VIILMTYFRSKFCVYFISVKWSNLMENIEKWRRCRMTINRNKEIEQSNFSLLGILFDHKKRNDKIYKFGYHMLMLIFSTGTLQCSSILISKRGQKNKDCCFWQSHHHLCLSRSSSSLYLFSLSWWSCWMRRGALQSCFCRRSQCTNNSINMSRNKIDDRIVRRRRNRNM